MRTLFNALYAAGVVSLHIAEAVEEVIKDDKFIWEPRFKALGREVFLGYHASELSGALEPYIKKIRSIGLVDTIDEYLVVIARRHAAKKRGEHQVHEMPTTETRARA